MAHINLLPWREELRKEQTRQFVSLTIFSVILTGALIFLVHVNINRVTDSQIARNAMLENEIRST